MCIRDRPMFSSFGRSLERSSVTFVSNEAIIKDSLADTGILKDLLPVENTRKISKKDMVLTVHAQALRSIQRHMKLKQMENY